MPETPLGDDQVDRPDVEVQQWTKQTGPNGEVPDHTDPVRMCADHAVGARSRTGVTDRFRGGGSPLPLGKGVSRTGSP